MGRGQRVWAEGRGFGPQGAGHACDRVGLASESAQSALASDRHPIHSLRRATFGSTRAARRAGTRLAAMATARSTDVTIA